MTPTQAIRALRFYWYAEERALEELQKMQAEAQGREWADFEAAAELLKALGQYFHGTGLMTRFQTGRDIAAWPNAYPTAQARAEAVERWKTAKVASLQTQGSGERIT